MCSIGGFSLAPGSKINSRALANALLTEGESRGTDASGWAYTTREGKQGMFKKDVPGSQLSIKGMPRKADSVIIHTRFATQGHQKDNSNNHPQVSPKGTIRLVHNGHIDNDQELRDILTGGEDLPTVDTSVIPAVLEQYTTEGTSLIAGYAAVAWLDDATGNTLHLSRLDTSPVNIARLVDGSIVFASTERMLAQALIKLGIEWIGMYPFTFMELDNSDYVTITDGVLQYEEPLDWYDDYRPVYHSWGRSSSQGFSHSKTGSLIEKGYGLAEDYDDTVRDENGYTERDYWLGTADTTPETWESEGGYYMKTEQGFYRFIPGPMPKVDSSVSTPMALSSSTGPTRDSAFYAVDHDGDYVDFASLNALVLYLQMSGAAAETILTTDPAISWVNTVLDLGEVKDDGELVSWVKNPEEIEPFDAETENGLAFILEGALVLQNVMVS